MAPSVGARRLSPLWWPQRALVNVLLWCAVAAIVVWLWVLGPLGGWRYYNTPIGVRAYDASHDLLKPSGGVGHLMGVFGVLMLLVPVAYSIRKHWAPLQRLGTLKGWLEVHVFCGVVGPVLITVHAAMRFGGLVSVAYWSMILVFLSGFVGRYLFVRIPKTIRGAELGYDDIAERATDLKAMLLDTRLPAPLLRALESFERATTPRGSSPSVGGYLFGQLRLRWALRRLRHDLDAAGTDGDLIDRIVAAESEREMLLGRLAYLEQTKRMFAAWHVFHQPLAYVMFAIVAAHIGLALYLGYRPF